MAGKFSLDLEHCIFSAVSQGHLSLSTLRDDEFSKEGRWVLSAFRYIAKRREPPFSLKSVFVAATDTLGGDRVSLRKYFNRIADAGSGAEAGDLLQSISQKKILVDLINEAGEQLSQGEVDTTALLNVIDRSQINGKLQSLATMVGDKLPPLPSGFPLPSLPSIQKASGGLFGLWAIGGESGVGKSTLAIQIALEVADRAKVLYYDFEQGWRAMASHLGIAFGGNLRLFKRKTANIYVRESMRTLTADLSMTKPPALIVVDSVQKIPTSLEHRRAGLDVWVHKFEALKKRGYDVLLVSEKNRDSYGKPTQGGYKESGEIEYAADFGAMVMELSKNSGDMSFHVVKNRHRRTKGHIVDLYRHHDFMFQEGRPRGRR